MEIPRMNSDRYVFSKQPEFVEPQMRKVFKQAVPLKTIVVHCYDPRAVRIPNAVAKAMPGEVYPGEIVVDAEGRKTASTTTIFPVVVAGGRAVDALRSITVAQHLFGIENIVVVHHTYCGATSFTPDGLFSAFRNEQGTDVSRLYKRSNIAIEDYESSLKHDVRLIRKSKGTPKKVNIFGYLFNIDTDEPKLMVEDRVAVDRGENAGRQAERQRKQHGAERKLDGRGKQRRKLGDHRLARDDRAAEIAMHDATDVAAVLNEERLVEPVFAQQLRVTCGIDAALARHGLDRVAGHDADQEESKQRKADESLHREA